MPGALQALEPLRGQLTDLHVSSERGSRLQAVDRAAVFPAVKFFTYTVLSLHSDVRGGDAFFRHVARVFPALERLTMRSFMGGRTFQRLYRLITETSGGLRPPLVILETLVIAGGSRACWARGHHVATDYAAGAIRVE
jgi:hypothetical protein